MSRTSFKVVGLRVSASLYARIVQHLEGSLPNEGVGLIAGRREGSTFRATAFYGGTNIDASPTRYTMAPEEVIIAFREMRDRGWDLAAIVHSHPATSPVPSRTDLTEAYYPEALMLIVGLAQQPPIARCWKLIGDKIDSVKHSEEVSVAVGDADERDSANCSA